MKHPEGKLIKMMREYAGLSLRQLGKRVHLSGTTIYKVESGEAEIISKESRERLLASLLKAIDHKRAKEKAQALEAERIIATDYKADASMTAACATYIAAAIGRERDRRVAETIDGLEKQVAKEKPAILSHC